MITNYTTTPNSNAIVCALKTAYERIENQCDELQNAVDELASHFEPNCFDECKCCEDCPAISIDNAPYEYWGARCYNTEYSCPADFDPSDGACVMSDEYDAYIAESERAEEYITKAYDVVLPAIERKLEELSVGVGEKYI